MRKNRSQKIWPVYQKCLAFYLTHIHGALNVLRSTFGLLGTYQCKAKNVMGWHHDICIKIDIKGFYAQKKTPNKHAIAMAYSQMVFVLADYSFHNHEQLKYCRYIIETTEKINYNCLFDLFPSACIKRQERTVSITIHPHWVCLSLHGQE